MAQVSPLPLPDWPARLHAQGRSMTWLAQQVGVSRTYLADVKAGRKQASPDLNDRITIALATPDRLSTVRDYAEERARWREVERHAVALAAAIRIALGEPR